MLYMYLYTIREYEFLCLHYHFGTRRRIIMSKPKTPIIVWDGFKEEHLKCEGVDCDVYSKIIVKDDWVAFI